jgi:hypothetical protein
MGVESGAIAEALTREVKTRYMLPDKLIMNTAMYMKLLEHMTGTKTLPNGMVVKGGNGNQSG